MAYTMVCLLEAKPEKVDEVKEYLLTVAKSFCQDPETITWTVQQDLCDPRQFCIVERYVSRKSEEKYHQANPLFKPTIAFLEGNLARPFEIFTREE